MSINNPWDKKAYLLITKSQLIGIASNLHKLSEINNNSYCTCQTHWIDLVCIDRITLELVYFI